MGPEGPRTLFHSHAENKTTTDGVRNKKNMRFAIVTAQERRETEDRTNVRALEDVGKYFLENYFLKK